MMRHSLKFGLWLSAVMLIAASPVTAQQQSIQLGAAWYPEQWSETQWDHDLTLMEQAHFTVIRVGEFAWSRMESSEGRYDLDWLARAVRLAKRHHIAVVLGTPTDAPPAWLTTRYPDTLGTDANGHLREHGERRQFSYSSPRYRQFCIAIAAQLAKRFGHDPNVIGWQIGNEYTDESFDAPTRTQFQQFLKAKFKTLDSLNQHWATAYWSQTYTDWAQIPLPAGGGNPGLLLEHKHFVTATWRSFQHDQIAAIRPLADARQFITTNIGGLGWSDNWDHYAITEDLDLASWDEYVGQGHLAATKEAFMNDFARGWKRRNFWVMETQPGSVNWAGINNALDPGETRALAWQAIGHGADAILYWQWQDALNGQEQYHGAIVGPDDQPNPIYKEIRQLGDDLRKTSVELKDTHPVSEVAMLVDYDSRWAIDFQPHSKNYDQLQVLLRFYEPLAHGQSTDIVDPTSSVDLTQYKLLVAPSLNVIDDALAARLLAYVQQGGYLLLGPRTGMKDQYNALNPQRQPGPLAEALGAKVDQYYALDHPVRLSGRPLGDEASPSSDIWAETLIAASADTHTDVTYIDPNGWLDRQPAMVSRTVGRGSIAYLGTLPAPSAMKQLLTYFAFKAGRPPTFFQHSEEVEITARRQGSRFVFIVINHGSAPAEAQLWGRSHDLLSGNTLQPIFLPTGVPSTHIELPPQGVAVLVLEPN